MKLAHRRDRESAGDDDERLSATLLVGPNTLALSRPDTTGSVATRTRDPNGAPAAPRQISRPKPSERGGRPARVGRSDRLEGVSFALLPGQARSASPACAGTAVSVMPDQLVQFLNKHGYMPIFGRADLLPPTLYTLEKTKRGPAMQLRGQLARYLSDEAPPRHRHHKTFDEIAATSSSAKGIGASVNFLQGVLACIGISAVPKLDLSFAGSRAFKFRLTDIDAIAVEPAAVEKILAHINLDTIPPDLLNDGKTFIAYEYLAASTVTMERGDGTAFTTDIEGHIGEFIQADARVNVNVVHKSKVTFRGQDGTRAAFAAKFARITLQDGKRYLVLDDAFASDTGMTRTPVVPQLNAALPVEWGT